MAAVEIRISSAHVPDRMEEVRRWLFERGCHHRLTSTGSSDDRVVWVEFMSADDAAEFARHFSGSLVLE